MKRSLILWTAATLLAAPSLAGAGQLLTMAAAERVDLISHELRDADFSGEVWA